ncbi:hypothetical protein AN958_09303 [Leucoagaricus sp. SymC.cos]|nr:hypothetical protein AN958_09303 [Leucoagaricus sp. SymC.cos]
MLTKLTSLVTAALTLSGGAAYAISTSKSSLVQLKAENLSPNIQVCSSTVPVGCVTIAASSDSCVNFIGGLSFLYKEVSGVVIPAGLVCTFYE